jgi:hypothetical protein
MTGDALHHRSRLWFARTAEDPDKSAAHLRIQLEAMIWLRCWWLYWGLKLRKKQPPCRHNVVLKSVGENCEGLERFHSGVDASLTDFRSKHR